MPAETQAGKTRRAILQFRFVQKHWLCNCVQRHLVPRCCLARLSIPPNAPHPPNPAPFTACPPTQAMSFTVSMPMHTAALAECSHPSCHAAAAVGRVAGLRHATGRRGSMARASAAAVDRLSTRIQDLAEADLPPPPPPLKPVPVIHTQAYLVQTQQLPQVSLRLCVVSVAAEACTLLCLTCFWPGYGDSSAWQHAAAHSASLPPRCASAALTGAPITELHG